MKKNLIQVFLFFAGQALILAFFAKLLTPTWFEWGHDNTMKSVYMEPQNRVQILFLGTSQIIGGIAPIELYNRQGICAFNMGGQQQPLLASYYWLKEFERLHSKTLNTVVLDLSSLFLHETPEFNKEGFNEKSLSYMRLSPVKVEAIKAMADQYKDIDVLEYLFPLITYHNRWSKITETDFKGLTNEDNYYFTRGQHIDFRMNYDEWDEEEISVPNYKVSKEQNYTLADYEKTWDTITKHYLDQIAEFCNEHHINLIFIKIAKNTSDIQHDAMQYLADSYGIPLIDFNLTEMQEEIGMNFAYDYRDYRHPNVFGAIKITDYIGDFLSQNYTIEDIRGNKNYTYLEKQAQEYLTVTEDMALHSSENLTDYLKLLNNDRYTVFISIAGDGISGLTDEHRQLFAEAGFTNIGSVKPGFSYVGIKDKGKVIADIGTDEPNERISVNGMVSLDGIYTIQQINHWQPGKKGTEVGTPRYFQVDSAGSKAGKYSSIILNSIDQAEEGEGLNFAVYDNILKLYIDTSNFNSKLAGCPRTDSTFSPVYQARLAGAKLDTADSLEEYLDMASQLEDSMVIISGMNYSDITEEMLTDMKKVGLSDFDAIKNHAYLAILKDHEVVEDEYWSDDEILFSTGTASTAFIVIKEPDSDLTIYHGDDQFTIKDNSLLIMTYNYAADVITHSLVY